MRKRYLIYIALTASLLYWLFCLPDNLFPQPRATILLDQTDQLLGAQVAPDGQWRMPDLDSIPPIIAVAVTTYEDRDFYIHYGVSPKAILRALKANLSAGRIVQGGSTISMQVARMARGNKPRTVWQKMIEVAWATRLEWRYSKEEILALWLNNAPFGGNVVGLEAAAYRYYGRPPRTLSVAEAATLAVLPNQPGLVRPGQNADVLLEKRNLLIKQMETSGSISSQDAELAMLEPLPPPPARLPRHAPHLLQRLRHTSPSRRIRSTIDLDLQKQVADLVQQHHTLLSGNQIQNCAAIVSEVSTGRVLAYVGNVPDLAPEHAPQVDILNSPRSPGSLLKPILYAAAISDGTLLPRELLPDVPANFGGFQPANFYRNYAGAVPADDALARSLNIPFVYLLQGYGLEKFHADLKQYGFRHLTQPSNHYGLSLILGGGEVTATEINNWFLGIARQQRYFRQRQSKYCQEDFSALHFLRYPHDALNPAPGGASRGLPASYGGNSQNAVLESQYAPPPQNTPPAQNIPYPENTLPFHDTPSLQNTPGAINAGAAYATLEALTNLQRPDELGAMAKFTSPRPVAWKTGTSFGFRDAWASGCTPEYAVTVWTGNASGEGRAGLVGTRAAAPLFFRILRLLDQRPTTHNSYASQNQPAPQEYQDGQHEPDGQDGRNRYDKQDTQGSHAVQTIDHPTQPPPPRWFQPPYDDLVTSPTCKLSGNLASPVCPADSSYIPRSGERAGVCTYHTQVYVTGARDYRVMNDCSPDGAHPHLQFTLPPRQAHYYARRHAYYRRPLPWHPDCNTPVEKTMQFIYPYRNGNVQRSRNWQGELEPLIVELAHQNEDAEVHWHLDGQYLKTTKLFHQLALDIPSGQHQLTAVDDQGQQLRRSITLTD